MSKVYDVAIVGGGPGGMTAAIYASRGGLSVALIERGLYGGQLNNTAGIENFTGFDTIQGPELARTMEEHVKGFEDIDFIQGNVKSIDRDDNGVTINFRKKEIVSKTLVIATGVDHRKMNVPNEGKYRNNISNCATCDGMFYKGKHVAVIGGGDSAAESALYLSNIVDKVTLVHRRDELRAEKVLQDRLKNQDNIEFVWDAETLEFLGSETEFEGLKYLDKNTLNEYQLFVDGSFVNIGMLPNTEQFRSIEIFDREGFVITDSKMRTDVPNVFAIGDVRSDSIRQIASATGDGATVIESVTEYLNNL